MSNFNTVPALRQDIEKVSDSERSQEFRESFSKEPLKDQKDFLHSLILMRESEKKGFTPYTKETLSGMQDISYACETLLAMSLLDSMLGKLKKDPWTTASHSDEQLRLLPPIRAVHILLKYQADALGKKREAKK